MITFRLVVEFDTLPEYNTMDDIKAVAEEKIDGFVESLLVESGWEDQVEYDIKETEIIDNELDVVENYA